MRGRNNNNNSGNPGGGSGGGNRKGPNPLTRNYESNGPDVKIRGSAHQIAEKYMTLARDAQSAGDRVMAENYLQHAEHYNRIIAAAQAQMPQQFVRDIRDEDDEDEDRDQVDQAPTQAQGEQGSASDSRAQVNDGTGPQPEINGIPAEVALNPEAAGISVEGDQEARAGVNGHGGEADAPRRPRRPRRRRNDGERAGAEGAEAQADAAGETSERAEADPVA